MIVRDPTPDEAMILWPPRSRRLFGPMRALDLEEQREVVYLYRTGQAKDWELAERYGVSRRTIQRYIHDHRPMQLADRRLWETVARWGRERQIPLTTDDIATLVHGLTIVVARNERDAA